MLSTNFNPVVKTLKKNPKLETFTLFNVKQIIVWSFSAEIVVPVKNKQTQKSWWKKIQLGMETEYEYKEENEVVHFTLPSVV